MVLAILSLDLGGEYAQVVHYTLSTNCLLTQYPLLFPGRYTAVTSLWSAIATMLATLDFNLAKDADGNDIMFQAVSSHGLSEYVRIVPIIGFWSLFLN